MMASENGTVTPAVLAAFHQLPIDDVIWEREHGFVILPFLRERIRQPGEAPVVHPVVEILPLSIWRAAMLAPLRAREALA